MFTILRTPGTRVIFIYATLIFIRFFSYAIALATHQVFLRHHGMSFSMISFILAVSFIAIVIFELPTGAIADTFGRRRSYLLSCILPMMSMLVYFFWRLPAGLIIAEIIAGIGFAMASGSV